MQPYYLYDVYYQLVAQYLYLLLVIALTCFSHFSGRWQALLMYAAFVGTYVKVVDCILCSTIIHALNTDYLKLYPTSHFN
jgi:hypothetical protein